MFDESQRYASQVVLIASSESALDEALKNVVARRKEVSSSTQVRTGLLPVVRNERDFVGFLEAHLAKWQNETSLPLLESSKLFMAGKIAGGQYAMVLVWQSLGREVDGYVSELVRIGKGPGYWSSDKKDGAFNERGRNKRGCEIGERLNELGGMVLMRIVHSRVASQIQDMPGYARSLEGIWGAIGDWRS